VSETGNDGTGDGSSGNPYALVSYACTQASSGDTIYVNPGTITETAQVVVPVGVSIYGAGPTSIINSTLTGTGPGAWAIRLYSATLTDGNQSISYIKLTGSDYTAPQGIQIWERNNVSIHHCTIESFEYWGVEFIYPYSMGEPNPTEFCDGNSFYDNIITNCAGYSTSGYAALSINGQDGLLVYNNVFTQNKVDGTNGMCIKGVDGINKNVKIHDNEIYLPVFDGTDHWDFAIELWDCRGGVEIYDNYLEGCIDIGGKINTKGDSDYSVWIHDNTITQTEQALNSHTRGFIIEGHLNNEDIIIERNYIDYVCQGIGMGQPSITEETVWKNIRISYNIFNHIGLADSKATHSKGWGIFWGDVLDTQTFDNFEIYNNIFIAKIGTYSTMWGIQIPGVVATNIKIKNNIVENFDYAGIFGYNDGDLDVTCDYLWIENNCLYNNGNSNVPRYGPDYSPTHNTTQNNITTDPTFVSSSDFHLQSTSPCINAGIDVGLTEDFDGQAVDDPPEIGAYEYQE